MSVSPTRVLALLSTPLLAVGLAACGTTVSTAGFKGEEHEVAQTISNLQADATAGDQHKLCANDLASGVVTRLGAAATGASGSPAKALAGCERALKKQLTEIDNFDTSVQSVQVSSGGARPTASARVKSTYGGKTRARTVLLVKEGRDWKVAGVQ